MIHTESCSQPEAAQPPRQVEDVTEGVRHTLVVALTEHEEQRHAGAR